MLASVSGRGGWAAALAACSSSTRCTVDRPGRAALDEGAAVFLRKEGKARHPVRLGAPPGRAARATGDSAELAALGFHGCERDLEDELVRALGVDAALAVVEQEGHLERFRTFSAQPEWRGRSAIDRLHRFWGTTAGRKEHYGRALAAAAPAEPPPIAALLNHVAAGAVPVRTGRAPR